MTDKCYWYKANIPGHLESRCGVWIEADQLDLVWGLVCKRTCHKCGKRIAFGFGRLNFPRR